MGRLRGGSSVSKVRDGSSLRNIIATQRGKDESIWDRGLRLKDIERLKEEGKQRNVPSRINIT